MEKKELLTNISRKIFRPKLPSKRFLIADSTHIHMRSTDTNYHICSIAKRRIDTQIKANPASTTNTHMLRDGSNSYTNSTNVRKRIPVLSYEIYLKNMQN